MCQCNHHNYCFSEQSDSLLLVLLPISTSSVKSVFEKIFFYPVINSSFSFNMYLFSIELKSMKSIHLILMKRDCVFPLCLITMSGAWNLAAAYSPTHPPTQRAPANYGVNVTRRLDVSELTNCDDAWWRALLFQYCLGYTVNYSLVMFSSYHQHPTYLL